MNQIETSLILKCAAAAAVDGLQMQLATFAGLATYCLLCSIPCILNQTVTVLYIAAETRADVLHMQRLQLCIAQGTSRAASVDRSSPNEA